MTNQQTFHLVLELPDAPVFNSTAFRKVCNQYIVTRLIVGAARFGAETISITGPDAVVSAARNELNKDERIQSLPLHWGETAESELPQVNGLANIVIGKKAWVKLQEAEAAVHVPGAEHWTKNAATGETKPLWDDTNWEKGCFAITATSDADLRRAKKEIFLNITKDTSGPVSRYLNSKISIPLSNLLVETSFTPNQMTVTNTFVGIFSAICFAFGTLPAIAIGGIIFQLSAALDRNDGELARSKFMESEKGAWIDTVGDNITYVTFMVCFVIGYSRYANAVDAPWAAAVLPLGVFLVVATTGLIAWMFWYVKKQELGGTITAISRKFEDELDEKQVNIVYRYLSKLRVMGERDQFSLAIMLFAIMPVITGSDAWYHALFFITIVTVIAMNVYFVYSTSKMRSQKRSSV